MASKSKIEKRWTYTNYNETLEACEVTVAIGTKTFRIIEDKEKAFNYRTVCPISWTKSLFASRLECLEVIKQKTAEAIASAKEELEKLESSAVDIERQLEAEKKSPKEGTP